MKTCWGEKSKYLDRRKAFLLFLYSPDQHLGRKDSRGSQHHIYRGGNFPYGIRYVRRESVNHVCIQREARQDHFFSWYCRYRYDTSKKKFVNNYGTSQEEGKDTKVLEKVMIIIVRNSNNKGRLTSLRELSERLRVDVSFVRKWNHDVRWRRDDQPPKLIAGVDGYNQSWCFEHISTSKVEKMTVVRVWQTGYIPGNVRDCSCCESSVIINAGLFRAVERKCVMSISKIKRCISSS